MKIETQMQNIELFKQIFEYADFLQSNKEKIENDSTIEKITQMQVQTISKSIQESQIPIEDKVEIVSYLYKRTPDNIRFEFLTEELLNDFSFYKNNQFGYREYPKLPIDKREIHMNAMHAISTLHLDIFKGITNAESSFTFNLFNSIPDKIKNSDKIQGFLITLDTLNHLVDENKFKNSNVMYYAIQHAVSSQNEKKIEEIFNKVDKEIYSELVSHYFEEFYYKELPDSLKRKEEFISLALKSTSNNLYYIPENTKLSEELLSTVSKFIIEDILQDLSSPNKQPVIIEGYDSKEQKIAKIGEILGLQFKPEDSLKDKLLAITQNAFLNLVDRDVNNALNNKI